MKKSALLQFAITMAIAVTAHAMPTTSAASAPPAQSDREWKLNLLAEQVESRAEAACNGHKLSGDEWKGCMLQWRIGVEATFIVSDANLHVAGMTDDALQQELVERASKLAARQH